MTLPTLQPLDWALMLGPLLGALLAQPLRDLAGRGARLALLLAVPPALLGAVALPGWLGRLAEGDPIPGAIGLTALLALLAFPLALLAAVLLARPEPAGLRRALAGLGMAPLTRWRRLSLPALLPGLLAGWALAGLALGLALALPLPVRP